MVNYLFEDRDHLVKKDGELKSYGKCRPMLEQMTLKFGETPASQPLEVKLARLTLFVGPNNSGKTLVLNELENALRPAKHPKARILAALKPARLTKAQIEDAWARAETSARGLPEHHIQIARKIPSSDFSDTQNVDRRSAAMLASGEDSRAVLKKVIGIHSAKLDGAGRLLLCSGRPRGDLKARGETAVKRLFQDEELRTRVRSLVHEAFGLYLVVDPTYGDQLRLRLSSRLPADSMEEQALDPRAIEFHRAAISIDQMSDGVKAFVGVLVGVLAGGYSVVLIDEPEAFLHPPLVRRLGKILAKESSRWDGNLFAATHSADFILGAVQSGESVQIIRLTHEMTGESTARLLDEGTLSKLMRDPFLRSAGVLSSLFHQSAVVCEGDADRAFYQETAERLTSGEGPQDCAFLNAQGKQNEWRIVGPLRALGVPTAAVVDLDVVKRSDGALQPLLKAAGMPEELRNTIGQLRGEVAAAFRRRSLTPGKDGIDQLDERAQIAARALLRNVADFGIFVVPGGAVESWLAQLGASGTKGAWLSNIFELMGTDPASADYVMPANNDVWAFLREINAWLRDPHRQGL